MQRIGNKTFDELARLVRERTQKDIEVSAILSGDVNLPHIGEVFVKSAIFQKAVTLGMADPRILCAIGSPEFPSPAPSLAPQMGAKA